MTIATGALLFCIACVIATIFVLCVVIAGSRAEIAEQFREIQFPSQHTQHLSDNASERRGDGEGIRFDHEKGNEQ